MTQPLTPARREATPLATIRQTLASNIKTVNALLAGYTTPERFMGGIVTALQINPELQECNPQSVLLASLRVAQLRLSPDPVLGHAYLIPRSIKIGEGRWEKRAEFQLGYKGTLQLLYRSALVRNVRYNVVRVGERFRWVDGATWALEHEPGAEGWPTTWDDLVAAWAIIELTNGGQIPRVMYAAEIRRHKERGKGAQPAWGTDLAAMAVKTVLGDVSRRGPLDGESILGLNLDHQGEVGLGQQTADLEEMVQGPAAAQRAAEAIVGRNRAMTGTVQPDGAVRVEMPETTVQIHERKTAPSNEVEKQEPAPVTTPTTTTTAKPWQPILDLKLPRVGDTIASRLLAAGIDSFERIIEAGRYKLAEIDGISDIGAQAIVLAAETALGGTPPETKADPHAPEPADLLPEGKVRQAVVPGVQDPFEGMETVAPTAAAAPPGEIPFPDQKPMSHRPTYIPPTGDINRVPIGRAEIFALERAACATKRGELPAGKPGDDAAIAALHAFVKEVFGVPINQLPKGLYRAAYRWAESAGDNPEPEELAEMRKRGFAR